MDNLDFYQNSSDHEHQHGWQFITRLLKSLKAQLVVLSSFPGGAENNINLIFHKMLKFLKIW